MAAPVSIGQVAAETGRKRRKRKPKPVHESDVADHLWEAAKEATGHPPTRARVRAGTRTTAEERTAKKRADRAAVDRAARDLGERFHTPRAYPVGGGASRTELSQLANAILDEARAGGIGHKPEGGLGSQLVHEFGLGIPELIHDPTDWRNAVAVASLFVPGRVGRHQEPPIRIVGGAVIPAAGGAGGRVVERAYDRALGEGGRLKRGGKETRRTQQNLAAVDRSVAHALDKLTGKLSGAEQEALRTVIEGESVPTRIALHTEQAANAGIVERQFHEIHLSFLERARDLVREGPDGHLELTEKASANLRDALRLALESDKQRERILFRLDALSPARAAARKAKPGQIYRGGRWLSKAEAEALAKDVEREFGARADEVLKTATGDAKALKKRVGDLASEEARLERQLERQVGETPAAVAENAAVNRRALAGASKRESVRKRIDSRTRALGRAKEKLEDEVTKPNPSAAATARAVARVHAATKNLKALRSELDKLVAEGAATAKEQELWADLARQADAIVTGRLRAGQVSLESKRLARQGYNERIRDVLDAADVEARNIIAHAEDMAATLREKGGSIVGGIGEDRSLAYLGYERGVPGSLWSHPLRYAVARIGGTRSAIGGLVRDPRLSHELKGLLIMSGRFATNATGISARALYSALRLDAVDGIRKAMLGHEVDVHEFLARGGDIKNLQAIKRDPKKNLSQQMRDLFDALDAEEALDPKLLDKLNPDIADVLKNEIFPEYRNSLIDDPNIAWVPKEFYEGVFYQEGRRQQGSRFGDTGLEKVAKRVGTEVWGTLNDFVRVAYLYTLPHYYVLNMVGNAALNVMHMGVFLPKRYYQALRDTPKLKIENSAAMADAMGAGFQRAMAGNMKNLTHRVVGPWGNLGHILVDVVPRRSAFWHEAARQGYKDWRAVDKLIDDARAGNAKARQDFDLIVRRAKDAIGDYERLSPIERDYVAKAVFFYPFVKAMSRYTARFALEHPYQAAAIAYLGWEQQQEKPEGPWYTDPLIRIPEKVPDVVPGIGGMDIPFGGDVTNLQAVLPFGVLPGVAQTVYGAATGNPNTDTPYGQLNPIAQSLIVAITGHNEHGAEVPGNIFERFGRNMYEELPWKRRVESYMETPQERADHIYPREGWDLVGQIIGGSAAPAPYNEKLAVEREAAARGDKKPEFSALRKDVQWAKDHPEFVNPNYIPFAVKYRQNQEAIQAGLLALAKDQGLYKNESDTGVSKLGDQREYAVKLNVLYQTRPELFQGVSRDAVWGGFRRIFEHGYSADIGKAKAQIDAWLSYADALGGIGIMTVINNAQTYQKDKAKATRLASG